MGLFNKIKDILFVEEEELPVITKKEESHEETKTAPKKEVEPPVLSRQRSIKRDIEPKNEVEFTAPEVKEEGKSSSPFLAFDEEEFDRANKRSVTTTTKSVNNNVVKTTTTSVKRVDYKDYSRYEIKKVEERKPFRPSPVISPVYGILDKNYKKEDVVNKTRTEDALVRDVDSIRKKAFGGVENTTSSDEELMPKKVEEKSIDDLILDGFDSDNDIEIKNIEPLDDVEDEVIVNDLTEEDIVEVDPIITHFDDEETSDNQEDDYQLVNEHTSALEILDEIEKELNKQNDTDSKKDTLEGDLFNLIDSMYDDRKGDE